MKDLNFIRGRWRKLQLIYIGIDFVFLALVAFMLMLFLSVIFSWFSKDDVKVESYLQTKIAELKNSVAEYDEVKSQRDKLLDMSSDLENIKASQYYILLGIEKLSRAITDQLYITNIGYVASDDSLVITGETKDLKLLSIFMKNIEIEFKVKKVELKNLGSNKNGQRSFSLEFPLGEANAFKGGAVE
ncbi:MAG: type IV pili associated protein [Francisella sp.]